MSTKTKSRFYSSVKKMEIGKCYAVESMMKMKSRLL